MIVREGVRHLELASIRYFGASQPDWTFGVDASSQQLLFRGAEPLTSVGVNLRHQFELID